MQSSVFFISSYTLKKDMFSLLVNNPLPGGTGVSRYFID